MPGSLQLDEDENAWVLISVNESEENIEGGWTLDEELISPILDMIASAFFESVELLNTFPATKSSIEALKEVKVNDLSATTAEECSICLEKFSFEKVVVTMPCSHSYHKDCIVRWLETSHTCPLCRYAMPT